MGGAITTEQAYTGGDADYSAQLTPIRESKPDVVFLPATTRTPRTSCSRRASSV
jgi:hypothetical protein